MAGPLKPLLLLPLLLTACGTEAAPLRTPATAQWIDALEQQALADGVSPQTVHAALDAFTPDPRVVEADRKQPETRMSFAAYRHHIVSADRIREGRRLMHRYGSELATLESRTGVPAALIVALWGMESSYGGNSGDFEIVRSLTTLVWEGRRADYFTVELIAALHILDDEGRMPSDLRGSWAGAMGQCQFMPTTYRRYAVDEDGDGRRDIWKSTPDVLASIATYLAAEGWQRKLPWGWDVTREGAWPSDLAQGIDVSRPLPEWKAQGLKEREGTVLPDDSLSVSFLRPDPEGAAFLVTDNLRALLRWNHSISFALGAGLLADQIGKP